MSDQKKESFRELLQRYHVGEQPQTREEGQPLPHRGLAPTTRFEPGEVCLPRISQTTDDLSHLDDCLVSILVEDILEHSLPYIHAVPLFVAVKAYGITCKRVSLLCSIYLENAIYRGKDPSAQSLIPDSEKRYIVGKLKAVLDEIPTLTTLSEQKESTLRGEINRGYYKILSAFIYKKDLREFMRLAGERQIVEAEGLPFNYCEGINLPAHDVDKDEPQGIPAAICQEYKDAIAKTQKGKKDLYMALLYAQGKSTEEIAEEVKLKHDPGNIRTRRKAGMRLAKDQNLTDLTPYLEQIGRKGL
jgi:hypothetical protein